MPDYIQIQGGAWPQTEYCTMVNRTGAALAIGDIVAQNRDFSATAGNAMVGLDPTIQADGATGWIGGSAVTATAANSIRGAFVAADVIADNAEGRFVKRGQCLVKMNTTAGYLLSTCNNDGTISATATAAIGYQNQTALDAISLPIRIFGLALETTTTTGQALWNSDGWAGFVGGGG